MDDIKVETWWKFTGTGVASDVVIPPMPSWRKKMNNDDRENDDAYPYIPLSAKEIKLVNAALYLRRPLLITGKPGGGKSSLARAVAKELGLGEVLNWRITTETTLNDGLYRYDALSRLNDSQFIDQKGEKKRTTVAEYLTLEAIGVAFTSKTQKVVLIDEIDKSDVDLPNNLLHIFEENSFEIPELKREKESEFTHNNDQEHFETIFNGAVTCQGEFPLIIMTSNGDKEFSPAFMRRVLHLDMAPPTEEQFAEIVNAHFKNDKPKQDILSKIIGSFMEKNKKEYLSTDQLLNAVYLIHHEKGVDITDENNEDIIESIWHALRV